MSDDHLRENLKSTRYTTLYNRKTTTKNTILRIIKKIKSCPRIMRTYQILEESNLNISLSVRKSLAGTFTCGKNIEKIDYYTKMYQV